MSDLTVRELVEKALIQWKNGLTIYSISEIVGKDSGSVRSAINALVKDGTVKRLGTQPPTGRGRPATIFTRA